MEHENEMEFERLEGEFYKVEYIPASDIEKYPNEYVRFENNGKYARIRRVKESEGVTNIVSFGDNKPRCPHCGDRICVIKGRLRYWGPGMAFFSTWYEFRKQPLKRLYRNICHCTAVGKENMLFIVEDVGFANLLGSLLKRHCLNCNGKKDQPIFGFDLEADQEIAGNVSAVGSLLVDMKCRRCGYHSSSSFDTYPLGGILKCPECSSKNVLEEKRDIAGNFVKTELNLYSCSECRHIFLVHKLRS